MDGTTLPNTQNEEGSLQTAIDMLATRVDAFEHKLHEAMASEQDFRSNLETVSHALDSFVENHRREDMHLTRMIQEDTQRSREAREEYDILAARFDHSIRPHRSTKLVQLFKTISLYIGIVLSVVLMAPIQAIVWLLESLLHRLGYRKQEDAYGTDGLYGERAGRNRTRQNWTRRTTATQGSSSLRERRKANVLGEEKELKRPDSSRKLSSEGGSSEKADKVKEGKPQTETFLEESLNIASTSVLGNDMTTQSSQTAATTQIGQTGNSDFPGTSNILSGRPDSKQATSESDSTTSEEDFVDANAGVEESGTVQPNGDDGSGGEDVDENNDQAVDESGRPDWAQPLDDNVTLPELTSFPSAEFWNISEDEIRLEFLRREANPSSSN